MRIMSKLVGVVLKKNGRVYFFDANNIELFDGAKVVVDTERGKQIGTVINSNINIEDKILEGEVRDVIRIADDEDIEIDKNNKRDAVDALSVAHNYAKELKLNMSFTDASYNLDRSQLIFSFVSDSRVDFRELAKMLASDYKTRIELRQIGVRDKAKNVSGLGQCGRELCCASFLNDLDSVSINMAKDQNLALNPTKINGQCGRLLCCLKYEDDIYIENKKGMPSVGKKVTTDEGEGRVISIDILNRKYTVSLENGNITTVKLPNIESEFEKDESESD